MKLLFQNIDITCLIDAQTVNRRDNENRPERRIPCSMLDFGAARRFDPERIEAFPTLVTATLDEDQDAVEAAAISVGYLSPEDDPEYRQAVVDMVTTAAEPSSGGTSRIGPNRRSAGARLCIARTFRRCTLRLRRLLWRVC